MKECIRGESCIYIESEKGEERGREGEREREEERGQTEREQNMRVSVIFG